MKYLFSILRESVCERDRERVCECVRERENDKVSKYDFYFY